ACGGCESTRGDLTTGRARRCRPPQLLAQRRFNGQKQPQRAQSSQRSNVFLSVLCVLRGCFRSSANSPSGKNTHVFFSPWGILLVAWPTVAICSPVSPGPRPALLVVLRVR